MAARKKKTRKPRRKVADTRWYDSNWFLLVLAVLVVVGVRVSQVRRSAEPKDDPAEAPAAETNAEAAAEAPTEGPTPPPEPVEVSGSVAYRGMIHDEVVVPTVDRRSCPEHVAGALRVTDGHLADALVWVQGAGGEGGGPQVLELTSRDCQVEPRASVAGAGATLTWTNADDVEHHFEARDPAGAVVFSLDLPPGEAAEQPLNGSGLLTLTCTRHPWERATVLVTETGHAAVTDVDGRFDLGRVPPPAGDGAATLSVSHPLLDPHEQPLELAAGEPLDLRIDLTERAL